METKYILLSLGTATFGFLIWYAASASLRLPKTFQIQYDINGPFVNRFLRRRLLIFVLYVLIPVLLVLKWKVLGEVTFEDLGINFHWSQKALIWVLIFMPITFLYHLINAGKDFNLVEYPEIRVTIWSPRLITLSMLTWALQIFAIEFLFRGILLQALLGHHLNAVYASIISTGLYALTLYFKQNRVSFFCIPYGLLSCYIVIDTGSLLPAIIIHLSNALFNEWISIKKHPEIKQA